MVERLPLHQPVAPEEAAPAGGVSMVQAGVDSKTYHFIVVRVLHMQKKQKQKQKQKQQQQGRRGCGVRVRD